MTTKTGILPILTSETFQMWLQKTNQVIDSLNQNVLLAAPGPGFTTVGNSTLNGTFTSTNLNGTLLTTTSIVTNSISNSVLSTPIDLLSPIAIMSNQDRMISVRSISNRPIISLINGANVAWNISQDSAVSGSALTLSTEGASTAQVRVLQSGRLIATSFQGDGALITNINFENIAGTIPAIRIADLDTSKITSGVFNTERIPSLSADKITSGTIADTVLPDSAKRSEITETAIANIASSTLGFISGRRFNHALVNSTIIVRTTDNQNIAGQKTFTDQVFFGSNVTARTASTRDSIVLLPTNVGTSSFSARITTPAGGLTATRTLTLANGDTTLVAGTMVPTTRRVNTGGGLTGGGELSSNVEINLNIATKEEAEAGVNNVKAMTPLRVKEAIQVSIPNEFGAIGTYAMLRAITGGPWAAGETSIGPNLSAASSGGTPTTTGSIFEPTIVVLPADTVWRCMGRSAAGSLSVGAVPASTTLWVRIS